MKPFKKIATGLWEILIGLGIIWTSNVIPNFVFKGMENIENIYINLYGSTRAGGPSMDVYLISDPLMFWSLTIGLFGTGVGLLVGGFWELFNYRKKSKQENN